MTRAAFADEARLTKGKADECRRGADVLLASGATVSTTGEGFIRELRRHECWPSSKSLARSKTAATLVGRPRATPVRRSHGRPCLRCSTRGRLPSVPSGVVEDPLIRSTIAASRWIADLADLWSAIETIRTSRPHLAGGNPVATPLPFVMAASNGETG